MMLWVNCYISGFIICQDKISLIFLVGEIDCGDLMESEVSTFFSGCDHFKTLKSTAACLSFLPINWSFTHHTLVELYVNFYYYYNFFLFFLFFLIFISVSIISVFFFIIDYMGLVSVMSTIFSWNRVLKLIFVVSHIGNVELNLILS